MEMESLLTDLGCIVLDPVPRVKEALRVLADERPDAAVLDVNLQGERVTPVAAALRERGIPFVLVSGYGSERLQEDALRGAPQLRKPVEGGRLARALIEVLTRGERDP
jgi:CheY-like chemotaxis protein